MEGGLEGMPAGPKVEVDEEKFDDVPEGPDVELPKGEEVLFPEAPEVITDPDKETPKETPEHTLENKDVLESFPKVEETKLSSVEGKGEKMGKFREALTALTEGAKKVVALGVLGLVFSQSPDVFAAEKHEGGHLADEQGIEQQERTTRVDNDELGVKAVFHYSSNGEVSSVDVVGTSQFSEASKLLNEFVPDIIAKEKKGPPAVGNEDIQHIGFTAERILHLKQVLRTLREVGSDNSKEGKFLQEKINNIIKITEDIYGDVFK